MGRASSAKWRRQLGEELFFSGQAGSLPHLPGAGHPTAGNCKVKQIRAANVKRRFSGERNRPGVLRRATGRNPAGKVFREFLPEGLAGHLGLCTIVSIRAGENPAGSLTI